MNVIKEFTNVVYVGRGGGVLNPEPATIYIDKPGKTVSWLCPCGCGHVMRVKYRLCRPEDAASPIGSEVVNMNINDEGEVTMSHAMHDYRCPNSLLYCIYKNIVKVFGYAENRE